jgi:hypothetical protein
MPNNSSSTKNFCADPGLMNWPICDESLDGDTPAPRHTVLAAGVLLIRKNINLTFNLPQCGCCSISLPSTNLPSAIDTLTSPFNSSDLASTAAPQSNTDVDSYFKVCNRKRELAVIPWGMAGLVSRNLVLGRRCASATEVKGYYTYTSATQTWSLYIVGRGSAQIDDTTLDSCTSLIPLSVAKSPPAAPSSASIPGNTATKGPGNGAILPGPGSNATKGINSTNTTDCYDAWCFG